MKKLGYILVLVMLTSFKPPAKEVANEINWISIEEAVELQKKTPKKILMDVYTNWCGPCKMMDKNTFQNPDVIKYINENYYAVKFNAEGNAVVNFNKKTFKNPSYDATKANRRNSLHEFARFLSVRSFPSILYFDEQTKLIAPISGYLKPRQIELYLKLFKDDKHKEMNTQEKFNEYYQAFKPTFKE